MADEDTREEGGAEQAPPEADAPAVAESLFAERLATIRFVRETKWCTGTELGGPITETFVDGDEAEFPLETCQVFVGMGAAVWCGDEELAVKAAGETATRRRRRK
jgi:hypothetical protein